MNHLSPLATSASPASGPTNGSAGPSAGGSELRETFQQVVAGTFYKQMLDSLHKMHDQPAYFHGGQAEDIFQGRLNQQVADNFAQQHGAAFSKDLFTRFAQQLRFQGR